MNMDTPDQRAHGLTGQPGLPALFGFILIFFTTHFAQPFLSLFALISIRGVLQRLFQLNFGIFIISGSEIKNAEIVVRVTQLLLFSQALTQEIIGLGELGKLPGQF